MRYSNSEREVTIWLEQHLEYLGKTGIDSVRLSVKVLNLAHLVVVHISRVYVRITLTNEYVDLIVTADSFKRCADEFNAQLSDGIFETCAVGKILIQDIERKYDDHFESIKNEIDDVIDVIK